MSYDTGKTKNERIFNLTTLCFIQKPIPGVTMVLKKIAESRPIFYCEGNKTVLLVLCSYIFCILILLLVFSIRMEVSSTAN